MYLYLTCGSLCVFTLRSTCVNVYLYPYVSMYLSLTCINLCVSVQELDGVSFMLLTWSALTDVLHLRERDAVALCTHVSRVKYTYFTAFCN